MTNKYRNFLESNFVVVNRLFVLAYANEDGNAKRLEAKKYYLPNYIIKNYNEINNGKKLLWLTNWFWYETIWRN